MAYGHERLSADEARALATSFFALLPSDGAVLMPRDVITGHTFEFSAALVHPSLVAVFAVGDED